MVVGSIWPVDTRDGRSTARFKVPFAREQDLDVA
jgi:hypothetical protein